MILLILKGNKGWFNDPADLRFFQQKINHTNNSILHFVNCNLSNQYLTQLFGLQRGKTFRSFLLNLPENGFSNTVTRTETHNASCLVMSSVKHSNPERYVQMDSFGQLFCVKVILLHHFFYFYLIYWGNHLNRAEYSCRLPKEWYVRSSPSFSFPGIIFLMITYCTLLMVCFMSLICGINQANTLWVNGCMYMVNVPTTTACFDSANPLNQYCNNIQFKG